MIGFQYHSPTSLDEALSLLKEHGDDARVIAGGTALVLFMKQRLAQPGHLVSLRRIPGLDNISATSQEARIGALCAHRAVETSPVLRETVPLVVDTFRQVATPRIRNMATVGGGLVHADPSMDPPPSLIALGARVVLESTSSQRDVPLDEFFLDYYETAILPGEILTGVVVPAPPPNRGSAYLKFLPRTADDYGTVSAAVLLTLDGNGGTCKDIRIGLGSLGNTPIRARAVEAELRGQQVTTDLIRRAAEAVEDEVDPLDDFRGSAQYKREMAQVFVRRAIERAASNIRTVPA